MRERMMHDSPADVVRARVEGRSEGRRLCVSRQAGQQERARVRRWRRRALPRLSPHRMASDADLQRLVDREHRADLGRARPLDHAQLLLVIVAEAGRVKRQGLAVGLAPQVASLWKGDHKAPRSQGGTQLGVVDLAPVVEAVGVDDEREPTTQKLFVTFSSNLDYTYAVSERSFPAWHYQRHTDQRHRLRLYTPKVASK